jgi:hypothetical protein
LIEANVVSSLDEIREACDIDDFTTSFMFKSTVVSVMALYVPQHLLVDVYDMR